MGEIIFSGEISFLGAGVPCVVALGVGIGDFAALDGIAVGVGDIRVDARENFDLAIGLGFGVGVCEARSTPR